MSSIQTRVSLAVLGILPALCSVSCGGDEKQKHPVVVVSPSEDPPTPTEEDNDAVEVGTPDEEHGAFTDSLVLDGDRFGLIAGKRWTATRMFDPKGYSEPSMLGFKPKGRRYLKFHHCYAYLLKIDLKTLETEVVYQEELEPGHVFPELRIQGTREEWVLLLNPFDPRSIKGEIASWWYLFNVKTEENIELSIGEHFSRYNLGEFKFAKIVTQEGDLLLWGTEGNYIVRSASGDWHELRFPSDRKGFKGARDGQLFFGTVDGTIAYDLKTHSELKARRPSDLTESRTAKLRNHLLTRGRSGPAENSKIQFYRESDDGVKSSCYLAIRPTEFP